MTAGFQVGPETVVSLRYRVRDAEGELVDAPEAPIDVVFGTGQLLPALESALEGLSAGDERQLKLQPRDAYGKRDPTALIEVDREEFPDDVAPGDRFEAESEAGTLVVLRVVEVLDEFVVVDTNHPLADQTVTFELEVVAVRPATQAEIAAAIARLEAREQPLPADPALSPPGRLLQGGARRYETEAPADVESEAPTRGNGTSNAGKTPRESRK